MKSEDFDKQIKDAQETLEKLQKAKYEAEKKKNELALKHVRPLAKRYHDLCCGHNHCDGCGWEYEGDNWNGSDHYNWLNKTAKLIGAIPRDPRWERDEVVMSEETFVKLLDAYANIKNIHPSAPFLFRKVTK